MDALAASLDKIRARSNTPVDPSADRMTYAAFPAPLKVAMKTAAQRNAWCRETWALQTALIQDALLAGRVLEATLIAGYSLKPPEMALEGTNATYPQP